MVSVFWIEIRCDALEHEMVQRAAPIPLAHDVEPISDKPLYFSRTYSF